MLKHYLVLPFELYPYFSSHVALFPYLFLQTHLLETPHHSLYHNHHLLNFWTEHYHLQLHKQENFPSNNWSMKKCSLLLEWSFIPKNWSMNNVHFYKNGAVWIKAYHVKRIFNTVRDCVDLSLSAHKLTVFSTGMGKYIFWLSCSKTTFL